MILTQLITRKPAVMNIVIDQVDEWQQRLALAGSGLLGIAVFLLIGRVLLIVDRHIRTFAEEWEFEQTRRVKLREGSSVYRYTEPLIDELSATALVARFSLEKVEISLSRGGDLLPWKPREFIAMCMMESLLLFSGIMVFGSGIAAVPVCVGAGFLFAGVYLRSSLKSLHRKAELRLGLIQRRLPFGIDLIALMMRAGAGFRDALLTVVTECSGHPFAEEFRRVLDDVSRGKTLHESLEDLDQRLCSNEIREMVFAIRKSEELGTPLAEIFSNLADQMRLRKSQWAEGEAGKAQIRMQAPQLVMMVACMLTILAPFVFQVLGSSSVP